MSLAFNFYGAGNIGDDLMLAGFLSVLEPGTTVVGTIPRDIASQEQRFPQVAWNRGGVVVVEPRTVLVGVGDTPFQTTSGTWFLENLEALARRARNVRVPFVMVGVGAEAEIHGTADRFARVLESLDHVWTRDDFTTRVLKEVAGCDPSRVSTGADLANIELKRIFPDVPKPLSQRKHDLALCFFGESAAANDMRALRSLLYTMADAGRQSVFIANEARRNKPFEHWVYRRMFRANPLRRPRVPFFVPDYAHASVPALVRHFEDYATVMSSRYHGLLAAAWAGCRVVALARSSKTSALCEVLGIREIAKPFTEEKLRSGLEGALPVDRHRLDLLAVRAENSVHELVSRFAASPYELEGSAPR